MRDDLAVWLYLLTVILLFYRAPEIGPIKIADIAILAAFLAYVMSQDYYLRVPSVILVPVTGFISAVGMSTLASPITIGITNILEFFRYVLCLLLFVMTFDYMSHRIPFSKLRRVAILAATVSSSVAIIGFASYMLGIQPDWVIGMMHNPRDARTMLFYYDPNHYASVLLIGYAFLYAELFDGVDRRRWLWSLMSLIGIFLVGVAVVTTGSRSVVGALIGMTGLLLALKLYERHRSLELAGLATAGTFLTAVSTASGAQVSSVVSLSFRAGSIQEALSLRLGLSKAAIEVWVRHPIVGVGPNNFVRYLPLISEEFIPRKIAFPHNTYLGLLAETGLVGALFGFTIAGVCLLYGVRGMISVPDNNQIATVGLLVGLMVVAVFLDIYDSRRLWFTFGLTLAAAKAGLRTKDTV